MSTGLLTKPRQYARRARAALLRAPLGTVENYQAEFADSATRFLEYLKRVDFSFPPASGRPIGVVLAPTVGTTAPWFFTMLAIGLRRRGRNVILIHDDIEFEFPSSLAYYRLQQTHLGRVIAALAPYLPIQQMSGFEPLPLDADDFAHLDWLVDINLRWWRRAGPITPDLKKVADRERECFTTHLQRSRTLFESIPL